MISWNSMNKKYVLFPFWPLLDQSETTEVSLIVLFYYNEQNLKKWPFFFRRKKIVEWNLKKNVSFYFYSINYHSFMNAESYSRPSQTFIWQTKSCTKLKFQSAFDNGGQTKYKICYWLLLNKDCILYRPSDVVVSFWNIPKNVKISKKKCRLLFLFEDRFEFHLGWFECWDFYSSLEIVTAVVYKLFFSVFLRV